VEPYRVHLEEIEVSLPGLPAGMDGLRILHLSDLESTGWGRKEEQVAAIGAGANADLVVVTGDLVAKSLRGEMRERATREAADLIAGLPSRNGTWFVEGHGERVALAARRQTAEALRAREVAYLNDEVSEIRVGDARLAIVGLGLHTGGGARPFRHEPGGLLVQDGLTRPASYLNLLLPEAGSLRDYEFSGEFRFSQNRSGIGITLYNQMPRGRDRFYRLRRTSSRKQMHLSPHGTVFSEGRSAYAAVTRPESWYLFRVRISTAEDATRVQGRIWLEGDVEPVEWVVDCIDATETRLSSGTIGLWAAGPGRKEFRNLRLATLEGASLYAPPAEGEDGRWKPPRAPDFILSVAEKIPAGAFPIVLSHSPDAFPHTAAMGWPLLLAGHTQGGQIRFPFLGALTTDTALGREFTSGLFRRGRAQLFITRGVGTTRVPFRFLAPPEVAMVTLRAARGDPG
jgi:predicted MPP superfamily phosphohydrolase